MKTQQKTDDTTNACEAMHLQLLGLPMPDQSQYGSNPSDRHLHEGEFRYILSLEENEEERRRAALGFPYRKPI